MSTPEEKLVEAAKQTALSIEAAGKAWYVRYSTWIAFVVGLIAGAIVGRYV